MTFCQPVLRATTWKKEQFRCTSSDTSSDSDSLKVHRFVAL